MSRLVAVLLSLVVCVGFAAVAATLLVLLGFLFGTGFAIGYEP